MAWTGYMVPTFLYPRGSKASNCSGKGPVAAAVGLHCYAASSLHSTTGRQRCHSWRGGSYRTAWQERHDTRGLLSFPCQEHSLSISFFFLFLLFFLMFVLILLYFLQCGRELQPKIMLPSQGDWHTLLGVCSKSRGFK